MCRLLTLLILIFSVHVYAEPVSLNNSPIRSFVQWYSEKTGRAIIINPDVKGNITVFNADVNQDNVDNFFKSVLNANGFIMIAGDPAIVSLPSKLPSQITEDSAYESDGYDTYQAISMPETVELAIRNFKLHQVRSSDVQELIKIFLQSNGGGNVVDYPGNNALIVSAPESILPMLAEFIQSVDVARDQVLIQSLMFETSLSDGVDLSFAAGSASGHKVAGGFNTSVLGNALSTAGGSFGIFDGNVLALSLRAVQSNANSKVISTPRILTQSGQTGYISVGKNVPFITGRVTGEAAGVNNPFQTIERHDIGISLKVTPIVMGNSQLVLTIDTRADSINNDEQASDIVTNQRQIQTTVQIKDGQTLLLGGLIDTAQTEGERSVPFISQIPIIGWLFQSRSDSNNQRIMYVLLTAHVIRAL
ncbi:secretin N-terminal domain-containing protein [Pectobacterium brasiliense]|uniref:secretin N-terminal domain-containing protein n=1 Tax=Pectobacterium brasiliense TaxID=180957 RepID=UPI002A805407|nr:secretin N-terminal domain-containing protein [Pectobacterium brasiliense]MDY4367992.1 secretin N-terminal domain-containing protein [Pectobacterium brasiliense]MDY7057372.1 secretin N-terminal domain-containing protein [Pectobacterium brasiliense]